MAPRWGAGSEARENGLGLAQGLVCGVAVALAFWFVLILLAVMFA